MNRCKREELYRDFVRSRQNWDLFGWPTEPTYTAADLSYFRTLEAERLVGRLQIEGRIAVLADYPECPE